MKKLWYIVPALLGLAAGYWLWHYVLVGQKSARGYIPGDALLVVESTELQQPPTRLLPHQVQLTDISLLESAAAQLTRLQAALADSQVVNSFLREKRITYSLHSEGRDQLSFLVYIPLRTNADGPFLERLQKLVGNGVRAYRHTFDNVQLTDVVDAQSQPLFSYFLTKNYLIISQSGLLVENVVRQIKRITPPAKREKTNVLTSGTRLWFDQEKLGAFLPGLYQPPSGESALDEWLSGISVFNFSINEVRNLIRAESVDAQGEAPDALRVLNKQEPQAMGCTELVPNHTAVLYHVSVSDAEQLKSEVGRRLNDDLRTIREDLSDRFRVETDSMYNHLTGEAALCQMESSNLGRGGRVALVKIKNGRSCLDWLDYQAAKIHLEDKQPRYEETYGDYTIRQINAPELPALWLGRLFAGFPGSSYYTLLGDYLLLGSDVQALRTLLNDYRSGNVWSNAARAQELLRVARPAQFTAIATVDKSWYGWVGNVRSGWLASMERSEESLRRLNLWMWQSTFADGKFSTALTAMKGGGGTNPNLLRRLFLLKTIPLEKPLIRRPFVVKMSPNSPTEIFVQSVGNEVTQVEGGGRSPLKIALSGPLASEPLAVDYFGNGQTQYLLLAADRYHLLARNDSTRYELLSSNRFSPLAPGNYSLAGGPPGNQQQLTLADTEGQLYTLSKTERTLRRVNRLPAYSHVISPVQVLQLNGKPHLILLEGLGKLNLVNAFGQPLTAFPVVLKTRFDSPAFLETGSRESDVLLQIVSVQGELMKINLKGQMVERRQLFRASKETEFRLLLEKTGHDWLLTSITGNTLTFLDKQGKVLFVADNAPPASTTIEYYNFGADVRVICLTTNKGTWLYNLRGQPLTERPLTSKFPVVVRYAEQYNKLFLYATTDKALEVWTVKIR
ncbi:MAG: hypothetical protein LH606_09315 [Cytophagaceae bacterium]|nr:hypothetical protein [Cytophagaceae bacterium]